MIMYFYSISLKSLVKKIQKTLGQGSQGVLWKEIFYSFIFKILPLTARKSLDRYNCYQ